MKRKVFINDVPNVTMYSSESGTNSNNCAEGCTGCNNGGTVVGVVAVAVVAVAVLASEPGPPSEII